MPRIASLLPLLAALAACTTPAASPCGENFCPTGTTCEADDAGVDCVVREGQCDSFADGTRCEGGGQHVCIDGQCVVSGCGDDYVDRSIGEQCDLGADNSDLPNRICRPITCQYASCGDGVVDTNPPDQPPLEPRPDEECDDGPANSDIGADACRHGCVAHYCGDGVADGDESPTCLASPTLVAATATFNYQPYVIDLDRDGLVDLLAAQTGPSGVLVAFGRIDGDFDLIHPASPPNLTHLAAGDIDDDGDLDVLGLGPAGVVALRHDGLRAFTAPTQVVSISADDLAVVDLDADGACELILFVAEGVAVAHARGDGTYDPPVVHLVGNGFQAEGRVMVGELTGDNFPDVLMMGDPGAVLFAGAAGATLAAAIVVEDVPQGGVIALADLDDDGLDDPIVATALGPLHVYRALGGGAFAAPQSYTLPLGARTLSIGDLEGDGDPDIICGEDGTGRVSLLRNSGAGVFTLDAPRDVGQLGPFADRAPDVDHDGYADLPNTPDFELRVAHGGDGPVGALRALAPIETNGAVGDIDGDGALDVVFFDDNGVSVRRGHGGMRFDAAVSVFGEPADGAVVVIGDLDGDHHPDVALITLFDVYILAGDGLGGLTVSDTFSLAPGVGPPLPQLIDIDGDGALELVLETPPIGGVAAVDIVHFVPGPIVGTTDQLSVDALSADLHFVDADGDGDVDLFTESVGGPVVRTNQAGQFGAPGAPLTPAVSSFYPVDLDGDGDVDLVALVVGGAAPQLVTYLQDAAGAFVEHFRAPTDGSQLVFGDLGGDGFVDVMLPGLFMTELWLGGGDGGFEGPLEASTPGAQALADVSGDGRDDIIGSDPKLRGLSTWVARPTRAPGP